MNVECIDFELGAAAAESAGHPDCILERDREEREREERRKRIKLSARVLAVFFLLVEMSRL